ncbi:MAG TPA: S-layer homology domain-containing protein [bacterium]|nr:S-layer homology domain-containing protein [bacterium]
MPQRWWLALGAAALLAFGLIPRVAAQPFTDTPANHWAYEALTDLAAKGLIQGYPDGTFKGDRSMTRYEMAMVVARLLVRTESIRVPAPPPAPKQEVNKSDLDMILRLMNEFRAELAAQDVRMQAVEEELNALKDRLETKTVQITGAAEFRYDVSRAASGDPLNGNPNTGSVSAGASPTGNLARYVLRLQFDGSLPENLHFITVLITSGATGTGASTGFIPFNSSEFGFSGTFNTHVLGTLDDAFLDWKNAFGLPLEIWLGRFGGAPPGTTYPVQFGPFGLLMNTAGDTWEDATGDSGFNSADGVRVALHLANLADLQVQAVAIRITGNIGALSYPSGEDAYGMDANVKIVEGLHVGGYYVANVLAQSGSTPFVQPTGAVSFLYHVYGPGGGSVNPATDNCPVAGGGAAGITCPAAGNGWGAYVQWDIVKGIHLDGEWAQWHDTVLGGTDSGVQAVVTWDLGELFKVGHDLVLTTGYQYYGVNFYPPYGAAELDLFGWDIVYPGNAQGFTATVSVTPWRHITLYGNYLTGNNVSNTMSLTEYEVGVIYKLAAVANVRVLYRDLTMGGVDQQNTWRAVVDYSF